MVAPISRSVLKTEAKNQPKNIVKNLKTYNTTGSVLSPDGGVGGVGSVSQDVNVLQEAPVAGMSRRLQTILTPVEVDITKHVLDQLGLSSSIAGAVAPTLHPTEVWALWAYARAAHLTPAWIATQLYDFRRHMPRTPDLSSRYDEVGRALAALDPIVAEQVVELMDQHCPEQPEAAVTRLHTYESAAYQAGELVWRVMAELRGGARMLPVRQPCTAASLEDDRVADPPDASLEHIWEQVGCSLQGFLPFNDWQTWIRPCALLDLQDGLAVIGTPNVFVRQEVREQYLSSIVEAFSKQLGTAVTVEVVIGGTHQHATACA